MSWAGAGPGETPSAGRAPCDSPGRPTWRSRAVGLWPNSVMLASSGAGTASREGGELFRALQRLRKDRVGARLQVEPGAAHGVVEAVDPAGVGAGDDDEIASRRRRRRPAPWRPSLPARPGLARQVAAALGQLLIFQVDTRHAGRLEQPHRPLDVQRFAEAGVGVAKQRQRSRLGETSAPRRRTRSVSAGRRPGPRCRRQAPPER